MRITYTVQIDETTTEYTNLEDAIRAWDGGTYLTAAPGGIRVREWDVDGYMVRDGWLLHVRNNGVVYLNPSLAACA